MTPAELRAARLELGLSQQALADSLGADRKTICRWELGRIEIMHPPMLALALEALAWRLRRSRTP